MKKFTSWNFVPIHSPRPHQIKRPPKKKYTYKPKKLVSIFDRSEFQSSVKNRNEYNDYDYLHKLNDSEKEWLYRFHREYLNDDFKHGKTIIQKSKRMKKNCHDMNNSRNRDIFSLERAKGKLIYLGDRVFKIFK